MANSSREKIFIVPAFDLGMQTKSSKFLPQDGEVYLAKNVDLNYRIGAIAKCLGYDNLGNTINSGNTILGVGALQRSSGTNKILAFSGTDAYIYNSGTGAWDAAGRSYTASQNFFTASIIDILMIVNGLTDTPESYNGTSFSINSPHGAPPKAKYITVLDNRVYLFGVNIPVGGNFLSRVWYSDLPNSFDSASSGPFLYWGLQANTDLTQTAASAVVTSSNSLFLLAKVKAGDTFVITTGSNAGTYIVSTVDSNTQITLTKTLANNASNSSFWVGGNWFDVDIDNSDIAYGVGTNSGRVLFFKRFSLSVFQKGATAANDILFRVPGAAGTTSQRSVVNIGDNTFYFADTGIWAFNGTRSRLISTPIQDVIDGISNANKTSVVGWSEGEKVLKMYVGDISNTTRDITIPKCVICHDTFSNAWWTEEYPDTIVAHTKWLNDNDLRNYIFSSAGQAFKTQEGGSYDGDSINMVVETWPIFPISPEVAVDFTRFKIFGEDLRDIEVQYKLIYYENGLIDSKWKRLQYKFKSSYEVEVVPDEENNHAAGFALRFPHFSASTRPVIEHVAAYHLDYELR